MGAGKRELEFVPEHADEPVLRTERETTQMTRADVAFWAGGLEPAYLDGTLERARPMS